MCMWEAILTWEVLTDEQYNMDVFGRRKAGEWLGSGDGGVEV
jgi:hypothetical protein